MSARGVYAKLADGVFIVGECLVIGWKVPNVHLSDGMPVYVVGEHPEGLEVIYAVAPRVQRVVKVGAWPGHWPTAGERTPGRSLFTNMEAVPWNGKMIPVFDTEPSIAGIRSRFVA